MNPSIQKRVLELVGDFGHDAASVGWLLCDRHPRQNVALRIVDQDLNVSTYTYGDLAESSRRVAAVLTELGIGAGDRVATVMGKGVDLVSVVLGIWRVGAVYVPLFTAFAADGIRSRLSDAGVRMLITDSDQVGKAPEGPWTLLVSDLDEGPSSLPRRLNAARPETVSTVAVGGGGPMVHMFTSGTTGKPKGVVHPVQYVAGWQSYLEYGLGVGDDSTFWCGADPGWAYGLYTAIVAPLAAGVPTTLQKGGFSARTTWEVFEKLGVTDYAAAPTVYRALRAADVAIPEDLRLQRLSSAGEPLTPEVNEWASASLGLEVHDHFGQTEMGMSIGVAHHPALSVPVIAGAMGTSLPGWQMTVLEHDRDVPAPPGTTGRLAVAVDDSPFMTFQGYEGGAGADRFCCGGRYYLTGDVASIDDDGIVRFSARDDDVILMAGYRIGPFDIESALLKHPAVVECAVVAAPDSIRGEVVEAHVVLATNTAPSEDLVEQLQTWVKRNYAAHAFPRQIHFIDALPKTPSGKIQRAELRRHANARTCHSGPDRSARQP
jgi:acetyl-CoA synthetase